jgi:hypothetical protein
LAFLLIARSGSGETLRVPSAFPSIQSAIDASSVGDTVLVAPGTYLETVDIHHQLTLLSEEGPESTTIDAQGQGTVVSTWSPAQGVVIDGFRITGGDAGASGYAGGINVQGFGGAVIRHNIIENNQAVLGTGGVNSRGSSIIEDNIIQSNNTGGSKAEGALVASGTVRRNIIRYHTNFNHYTAWILAGTVFEDNIVVNSGYNTHNVILFHGGGVIRNNTIAGNLLGSVGLSGDAPFEFTNNIIAHGNSNGLDCEFNGGVQNVIRCNDVWGAGLSYSGDCSGMGGVNGNISLDPLLCRDYGLYPDSPCAPENSPPGCGLIGAQPVCEVLGLEAEAATESKLRLVILRNPVGTAAQAEFMIEATGGALALESMTPKAV